MELSGLFKLFIGKILWKWIGACFNWFLIFYFLVTVFEKKNHNQKRKIKMTFWASIVVGAIAQIVIYREEIWKLMQ